MIPFLLSSCQCSGAQIIKKVFGAGESEGPAASATEGKTELAYYLQVQSSVTQKLLAVTPEVLFVTPKQLKAPGSR